MGNIVKDYTALIIVVVVVDFIFGVQSYLTIYAESGSLISRGSRVLTVPRLEILCPCAFDGPLLAMY